MWSLILLTLLPVFCSSVSGKPSYNVSSDLGPLLSQNASIVYTTSGAPRWSTFDAPSPGTVVNVVTEHDVLITVDRDLLYWSSELLTVP